MADEFPPSTADFALLGEMEIESAGDIFKQCDFIRRAASNAGLIVVQWANDVEAALASAPVIDSRGFADNPRRRGRKVARHGYRSAESLRAAAESAAKLPRIYLKEYSDLIQARRNAGRRKTFDPTGGL